MPNPRAILLDIEGTTSSIRFVYDVMFPYVRTHLDSFLASNHQSAPVVKALEQIAKDTGATSLREWANQSPEPSSVIAKVRAEVLRLMDTDSKTTGLKELQGLIWTHGFNSGELVAHVYPDVPPALRQWAGAGIDLRIYSSGSITAQKQFFGHTEVGNLLPLFKAHYDTTTGPKRAAPSYAAIASDIALPPEQILFLSDVVAELDAARQAGLQTALVLRPGNAPAPDGHHHPQIHSFADLSIP